MLKSRRRQLHGRIAAVLEEQFPEQAETQPDLVAHHAAEAGLNEKAIDYWQRAGERGVARAAMKEAAAVLGKALALLEASPAGIGPSSEGTRPAARARHHTASAQGLGVGRRGCNVCPGACAGRGPRARRAADPGASGPVLLPSRSDRAGSSRRVGGRAAARQSTARSDHGRDHRLRRGRRGGILCRAFRKGARPVRRGPRPRRPSWGRAGISQPGDVADGSPVHLRSDSGGARLSGSGGHSAATRRSKRFGRSGTTTAWSSPWATRAASI